MQLSKRETHLIELFIENGRTLTAQQLADLAKVSTKTIYRTVKKINELSEDGQLIRSETGKGLHLDYENYLKVNLQSQQNSCGTEPLERRNSLLLTLLFKAPKRLLISELFAPYFVSETVISNDLARIAEFLKTYDVRIQKKQGRLWIVGSEKNIRKAVNSVLSTNNLIEDTFYTENSQTGSYDLNCITSLLEFIEGQLKTTLSYPYNMNIFSHLYILLKRSREGVLPKTEVEEALLPEEQALIAKNQQLYELSRQAITKISAYLNQPLPVLEVFYLFQYLISSRIETEKIRGRSHNGQALAVTTFFAEEMSLALGLDLNNEATRKELLNHIEPLLYRLKNEIFIKNNLLKDIQLEYRRVFQQVTAVARQAEKKFQLPTIKESEIGFLTLYFVRYQELSNRTKRILIMCSSGVGTSELLKVKVKKAFPNIEIIDVLSAKNFMSKKETYQNIDLILTTIHLSKQPEIPTILVNAMFTKQDEARVKQTLGGI